MIARERPYGSMIAGKLPEGCAHCERGGKLVLFTTGLCPYSCYYCPISLEKRGKDVVFADEMKIKRSGEILQEAEAISATGAGITGGDPMVVADRTVRYIRLLKKEFGDDFHIHVYTMGTDVVKIKKMAEAGLDEIRFHPPPAIWTRMNRSPYPNAASVSRECGMDIGLEVPLIPDARPSVLKLIDWAQSAELDFVNLNEMEFSDSNRIELRAKGYEVGKGKMYGVRGSERAANEILSRRWEITIHYCTAAYKDSWQLRERLKRRAKNVARPGDVVTDDGTLVKGILEKCDLKGVERKLLLKYGVPREMMWLDRRRRRLEVAPWILEELAEHVDAEAYLIEEYPTADHLEVERRKLN